MNPGWVEVLRFFGVDNPSGHGGAFWSGIGADLAEFAIFGLVWRRVSCNAKGCLRIGLRKVPGTDHVVCHKHHPHENPSAEQILADHKAAAPTK